MCKICTQASPEGCARFYAIWCLAWGIILTVFWGFLLAVAIYGATLPDDQQPKSLQQKYRPYRTSRYDNDEFKNTTTSPEVNSGMVIATTSVFLIVHILYILAGALMCLGMNRKSLCMFNCGKVLSYFAPIVNAFTIVLIFHLVVHILSVIRISKYIKERWYN